MPADVTAAVTALRNCKVKAKRANLDSACELLRLNDEVVTTTQDIFAQVPEGRHPLFLWHFKSPGASVYLAGSIHILKAGLYPLASQIEDAFAASDHLVVEVDTVNISPQTMQLKALQYSILPDGQTIDDVLPAGLLKRVDAYMADQGIPRTMVASLKPSIVATQIALTRMMALGYEPQAGIEQHFLGQVGNKKILELETIDAQLELLTGASMNVQIDMLEQTLNQADEIDPMIADLIAAWLGGNTESFLKFFNDQSADTPEARMFSKRLLDDRNVKMVEKIKGYLASKGSYFVLVGSAHLAGNMGIVELLEKEGLTGRQVMSDDIL
jgi:uncharacterized protein YbaP (TraB family)